MAEQGTLNAKVGGSNPPRPTIIRTDNLNGVRGKKFPRVFVLGGRFRKGDAPPPEKRAVCASDGLEVRILHGLPPFEQTTLMGYGEKSFHF